MSLFPVLRIALAGCLEVGYTRSFIFVPVLLLEEESIRPILPTICQEYKSATNGKCESSYVLLGLYF
jgi:hypothetical protein